MQKLLYIIISLNAGFFLLSACKNKGSQDAVPAGNINKMAVEKVNASITNIPLTNRENWQLFVGSKAYNSIIRENNALTGTPTGDSFYFEYQGKPADATSSVYIYYASKKYNKQFGPVFKETNPNYNLPAIFNQSSAEDLMNADLLSGKFTGPIAPEISDVKLTHANALFEFDVAGLTSSDMVYVTDLKVAYLPYTVQKGQYKAIVTGKWIGIETGSAHALPPVTIEVRTSGGILTTSLGSQYYPINSNVKYKFSVIADRSAKTLKVTNISTSVWDNEIFPPNALRNH